MTVFLASWLKASFTPKYKRNAMQCNYSNDQTRKCLTRQKSRSLLHKSHYQFPGKECVISGQRTVTKIIAVLRKTVNKIECAPDLDINPGIPAVMPNMFNDFITPFVDESKYI